jgi:hypothetical protein
MVVESRKKASGLYPSSGFLIAKIHNVSETVSVSVLR